MTQSSDEAAPRTLCLSFLVRQAWLTLRSEMDQALAEHGLSVAQYATLLVLEDQPGVSIAELARMVVTTRQSANEMLAGMATEGLVERRAHPHDGRIQQVFLTPGGQQRLDVARPAVYAREQGMEADLSAEQRQAARLWLGHIVKAVGP